MIFLCFLGIFSQFEACQDRLGLTKRFSKDIFNVPDLGRVAPGWWRLSHISEGQNNSLFIPAWLLLCAHAWFMPWTRGEKKVSSLSPFVQMNVENPVAPGDGRIDERKSLGL